MAWNLLTASYLLNAIGGALVVALGAVLSVSRPRTILSRSLGVFAIGFGVATGVQNTLLLIAQDATSTSWTGGLSAAAGLGFYVAVAGLGVFALQFPRPARHRVALLRTVVWMGLPAFVVVMVANARIEQLDLWTSYLTGWFTLTWIGFGTVLVVFALRYREPGLSTAERRSLAVVSMAVGVYWDVVTSTGIVSVQLDGTPGPGWFLSLARNLSGPLLGLYWLWIMLRVPTADRVGARRVAWTLLAVTLYMGLKNAFAPDFFAETGLARFIMVGVLAYEILVNRFLGLEVKVRWGLSRGAIAGLLVATFFIVSEGAQQFIGDRVRNSYIGIAGAGLLLFALAPLQRVADRIAAKAIPDPAPDRGTLEEREQRFLGVARRFHGDGRITTEEERMLAHLADDLGISGGRAFELRRAAQGTASTRGRASPTRSR